MTFEDNLERGTGVGPHFFILMIIILLNKFWRQCALLWALSGDVRVRDPIKKSSQN